MPTCSAPWWVYIIRTVDDHLYSGVTTDVARRFREHLAGGRRASRYLKAHPPQTLAFSMPIGNRSQAQRVEHQLKRLSRPCKEALIRRRRLEFDPDTGAIRI
jgi:putative endonuclease